MTNTEGQVSGPNGWQLYKRLLGYIKPHLLVFSLSILGYLIFSATTAATAVWLGWIVDSIESENFEQIRFLGPLFAILIVITRGAGGVMGSYSIAHVANHVVHGLRCEMVNRLLDLPVPYYDKSTSGRLVSKVTYDVAQVTGAATNAVTVILREGLTVIGLMAALLYIDWKLTLVFIVIAPIVARTVSAAAKRFRKYSTQMQDSMGEVTQITTESIKGHRVVRTFDAKEFVADKFSRASERNRKQNMKMALTQAISTPFIQFLVSIAMAVLIFLAMSPGFFEDKSAGDFVTFITLAAALAKPIRQLSQVNAVIQRGMAAADSIFSLMDEPEEKDLGDYQTEQSQGKLEFKNVAFSYGREISVLQDISFLAEPGMLIALVGKSGSGKSTLVSMIPRFYEVDSGEILLDDVPIANYGLNNLRRQISLVTQEVVLFNATIAENIAYGTDEKVDREQITSAAQSAHAMEFISKLPDGLDTEVGDDAGTLSGGQRQRIAIARALLKDAPVLIMDEATSALDSESEQHIQQALKTLMKGRTSIVIAHRLSTIEKADLILVMENGFIIESGNHKQLLELNKQYAKLHRMQFTENDSLEK